MDPYEAMAAMSGGRVSVPRDIAASMVNGSYRPSLGFGLGSHYRRTDGTGCFHLVIRGDTATLHRDQVDPRLSLMGHLRTDVCKL